MPELYGVAYRIEQHLGQSLLIAEALGQSLGVAEAPTGGR